MGARIIRTGCRGTLDYKKKEPEGITLVTIQASLLH